ncbi:MAG: HEAT repeat domain-containing protein [Candidatus Brocadiia bacterium]
MNFISCGQDEKPHTSSNPKPTKKEAELGIKDKSIEDLLPPDLLKNNLFVQRLESSASEICLDALMELRTLKRKDTAIIFQKMLYNGNENIRILAVKTLGEMKYSGAIEDLVTLLLDEDKKVRDTATDAILSIGDKKAQDYLLPLLKHQYMYVRRDALYILSKISDEAIVADIRPLLNDKEDQVRWQAMRVLLKLKDREVIPIIPKLLESENIMDRQAALMAFQKFKEKSLIPFVLKALEKENSIVVAWVIAFRLYEVKDNVPIKELVELLSSTDDQSSLNAAWALGLMGNKIAIPRLQKSLNTQNEDIKLQSISALRKIGDKSIALYLVPFINETKSGIQEEVILALGELGDRSILPSIRPFLHEKFRLRKYIIRALGNLDDKEMVPKIYGFLSDPDPVIRYYACESLGKLESEIISLKPIIDLIDDQDMVIIPDSEGRASFLLKQSTVSAGALFALKQLTDQLFSNENEDTLTKKWKQWWNDNKSFLYWSDKVNNFIVDEEAKAVGIPTKEYRKTHPWPKEPDKPKEQTPK